MDLIERENEILDEFSLFSDWMEKYEYIIDLGKELKPIDEKFKSDEYVIKGCQSQVWLHAWRKMDWFTSGQIVMLLLQKELLHY